MNAIFRVAKHRRPRLKWNLCLFTLCFALAPSRVHSQTQPLPNLNSNSIDATHLREPIRIGVNGLVTLGDDPSYASIGFDDSQWQVVDSIRRLRQYFSNGPKPILWHRLHVQVKPSDTGLAISIEPYGIDRAFEVYVNGEKLLTSGQVKPYVANTRTARLLVPIPDDLVRTGALVIAIRQAAPYATWERLNPGFSAGIVMLGPVERLRDRIVLRSIHDHGTAAFMAFLGVGVGLVAIALFTSQPAQKEYLCIFGLGVVGALRFLYHLYTGIDNVNALWELLDLSLNILQCLIFLLLCQALTRQRFRSWLWMYVAGASLLMAIVTLIFDVGRIPAVYMDLAYGPYYAIFGGIVPVLLFRKFRRGNREAGILIVFLFFWSMAMYTIVLISILNISSIFSEAVDWLSTLITGFPFGPVNFSIFDIGTLLFWVSLALIMILRATRTSRLQAVLESEIAAASAVQHVILPEEVEAIPGFAVECVYLSAQQVSGDFFQVLPVGEGALLMVIGDVAGKGLPAALLVSVLIGAIRATVEYTYQPDDLLASLNQRLIGRFDGGFSTALAALIDANGLVTIANAGHLPPYLDGCEIDLPGALPLGVAAGVTYETVHFHMNSGSRLTFYSDGVVEARNHQGELFGFDRTLAISTRPAATIVETARQFGQTDDITVVAVTRSVAVAVAA